MNPTSARPPRFYVLLIGVDGYRGSEPLEGCVNDVAAVEAFLVRQAGLPQLVVHKLLAPGEGRTLPPDVEAPTRANIMAAIARLGDEMVPHDERVASCDRVLVYYSGHGALHTLPAAEATCEALAPVDFLQEGLIYDFELNPLLTAIARRTSDLTVILDCCHSAGATRGNPRHPGGADRFLNMSKLSSLPAPTGALSGGGLRGAQATTMPAYALVAACHAHERAREEVLPPYGGQRRGVLTYCLLEILEACQERLERVRWGDIWARLRTAVSQHSPEQQPWFLGPRARRVLGGPWENSEIGHGVRREGGEYVLEAGTLSGLGVGAVLAVYGPAMRTFPEPGSQEDVKARLGSLVTVAVSPGEARARPAPPDSLFEVPDGSQARLLKPGPDERLRVSLDPAASARLAEEMAKTAHRDGVALVPPPEAEAIIGAEPDGTLWLGDDLYRLGPGLPGPLLRLGRSEDESTTSRLRAALRHYSRYAIPLRLARARGGGLSEDALIVRVLDCNDADRVRRMQFDAAAQREVKRNGQGRFEVADGARVCFHVHNTLGVDLHVTLLLCAISGRVQVLETGRTIHRASGQFLWNCGDAGVPFEMSVPDGKRWGVDRIVAIGTDERGVDLGMLEVCDSLEDAIRSVGQTRDVVRGQSKARPRWTATLEYLQIGSPEGSGM